MNNIPSISVVIPLYNKEENIKKTIQSVLNQTYKNYEIIVINDGSTDNSKKQVESLQNKIIKIIDKPNGGVSSARNLGMKEAQYNYIAFLDGDDLWEPTYLEEMCNLISDFPHASMWGCNYDYYKNSRYISRKTISSTSYRGILNHYFEMVYYDLLFCSSSIIIDKKRALDIGGFDEKMSMGEDLDMWFRMILSYEIAYYNKTLTHYNLDGINRAMKKKHDYTKSFLCYTNKYKEEESHNEEFRKFINQFRCNKIIDLFANYDINNSMLNSYISSIDFSVVKKKWKIYCNLPFILKKIIALYYNNKITYETK
ncbi:MAG: glycosyltransferase family 2 protein [Bacteroidales bacterium]|nr:glycosyltransferase family 2 protein [Bacteroidales bacterium]